MINIVQVVTASIDFVVDLRADVDPTDDATLARLDGSIGRLEALRAAALALTPAELEYVAFANDHVIGA